MRTKISVALNGIELHSIDGAIVLQGCDENAPSWNLNTGSRAGNIGQHINSLEKRYRDITVSFAIAEKVDLIRRADILQQVNAWAAGGGELTVSYRDRQRLRVVCTALPAIKTISKWAESYTITFRACTVPFWESMDPTSVDLTARTSGSTTLTLKESAGGKLCFSATKETGEETVNTLTVSANGYIIAFSGLGLEMGETLYVDYDENDIQRLRIEDNNGDFRSVLAKRTTASDDDIPLHYGVNGIDVSAGKAVAWTLYTTGRWE